MWRLDGLPVGWAMLLMMSDPSLKLIIIHLCGGDIRNRQAASNCQLFGIGTFARASAAKNQVDCHFNKKAARKQAA
jgi:hypothetical protein